ncbi:hypothetical protein SAMN05216275_15215 [Streptosporangium canum]|uniref:Uncharacterized protein n=1 Tax=Streptosporangium canum TaxID=324952 RepID=A0A1I4EQG2_9ACTN|nr:hypothetical protein [Streptosporangium canum]SFL07924.1 hypothetical protein SAMN05216275_15215 [Streptosporangium canum]
MTPRRRTSTSTLLAGWLFADLLLGLTIIMLGAQAPPLSPVRPLADATQPPPDPTQPRPEASRPPPDPTRPQPSASRPLADATRLSPEPAPSPAEESPTPARPPSPSPAPSPCTGRVGGVRAKPITISFQVTPGAHDDMLAAQIRQELRKHRDRLAGQHAGMVLTFAADGGTGDGVRLATRVNTAIRETYPRIFGTAVTRNFHDLDAPRGSISMEIYSVTYGCSSGSGNPGSPDE